MFLNYFRYCHYILHSYHDCLPHKDDAGQRWFKLAQYFQRRSFYKSLRTTDGRRTPSEGKISPDFGSGEIKTYILLHIHMINKVKIRLNIIVTFLRALNCGFYYTRAALPFMKKGNIHNYPCF